MKKSGLFFGLLLIGAMATQSAEPRTTGEKEIRALEGRLLAAIKSRDVDAIMANYVADDSLLVFDLIPPRQYVGARAYRKDWEDFFATIPGPIVRCEITDLRITADFSLGFSHSIQHLVASDKDGNPVDLTLRVTDAYRKMGGKWLIVHEHISAPIDLASGKADLSSKP
jgi:uncharacterized protein (TIGR02246 family)